MRAITTTAVVIGIFALAGAAFAYGPGMGGWGEGWGGGHMMAPGYHMSGEWYERTDTDNYGHHHGGYAMHHGRGGYGPGNAWCYADQRTGDGPAWAPPEGGTAEPDTTR